MATNVDIMQQLFHLYNDCWSFSFQLLAWSLLVLEMLCDRTRQMQYKRLLCVSAESRLTGLCSLHGWISAPITGITFLTRTVHSVDTLCSPCCITWFCSFKQVMLTQQFSLLSVYSDSFPFKQNHYVMHILGHCCLVTMVILQKLWQGLGCVTFIGYSYANENCLKFIYSVFCVLCILYIHFICCI